MVQLVPPFSADVRAVRKPRGFGGEPREDLGLSSVSGAYDGANLGGEVECAVEGRLASVGVAGRRSSRLTLANWAVGGAVDIPRSAG